MDLQQSTTHKTKRRQKDMGMKEEWTITIAKEKRAELSP